MEICLPLTNPNPFLRIESVPLANGRLGLALYPGQQKDGAADTAWSGDPAYDLDAIKSWGADMVLTLVEDYEFGMLRDSQLGKALKARGIECLNFPIYEIDISYDNSSGFWRKLSRHIHDRIERGSKVLIFGRSGYAGTIAALLMTERGKTVEHAIIDVRSIQPDAVKTQTQQQWLWKQARVPSYRAKILQACLLGGAMGDSLGASIEFSSLATIQARFPDGVMDLPPYDGQRGAITDDTQMTLFTAEGLIRAWVRSNTRGICYPPSIIHHALLRWYRTQEGVSQVEADDVGLIEDRRLWSQCSPGMTCMSALEASTRFGHPARNNSKGCGTIMRVAPIALIAPRTQVRKWAIETSALTHGHITGQLAAAAWAEMLADVADGEPLEQVAQRIAVNYAQHEDGEEIAKAIYSALAARQDGCPETVESLGGGWVAEEALAIALYACLRGRDIDECLRIAVTHGGDSDSTAAIAGNMLGVMNSDAVLSHPWASVIQGADIISRLARDYDWLLHDPDAVDALFEFYPGW